MLIADVLGAHLASKRRVGGRGSAPPMIETCLLLNVSVCPATETNNAELITRKSKVFVYYAIVPQEGGGPLPDSY